MTASWTIRHGVPPQLRPAAARLYWRHFGHGLQPLRTTPRQGAALILTLMQPDQALVALGPQGGLVGIAGLRGAAGGFLSLRPQGFVAAFGPASGRLRHAALGLHASGQATGDLILDGVAVRRGWRGRGIARALVAAAAAEARRLGHPGLTAQVEAGNDSALAAWGALGFRCIGRHRLGWPWQPPAHVLRLPV